MTLLRHADRISYPKPARREAALVQLQFGAYILGRLVDLRGLSYKG